jgi:hypothetical protein
MARAPALKICRSLFAADHNPRTRLKTSLRSPPGAAAKGAGRARSTFHLGSFSEVWRTQRPSAFSVSRAGGVKRGSKEIEPYGPSLSTGWRKAGPRSKFQAGSRAETNLACGPWVARRSTPSSTGQANRPSSYGVTSRAITNAAARADRDLRKIPSRIASPSTNGPSMSRPEPRAATGRVTSSFVSVHGQCSFSMSANRA